MQIRDIEMFTTQQFKCLDQIAELISFDKENGEPAENTRVLEAFCDTQRKALEMVKKLAEKHKPALEAKEKAEAEKRQAQAQLNAAKAKEAQKKTQVEKDLAQAQSDETSLFCCSADAEQEQDNDEYGFEEMDNEED